ncbi:MAG: Calx-beta domain-containing protein, partial [Cyanobium sp.]
DADPWFNMPHQADDDFVRNMATYVRDNLEPGRKVYVEWANELWNFGFGFEASQWVKDQAAIRGLTADPDAQWIITGQESRRDFDIWTEVFKGDTEAQLIRVAAGQAANEYIVNAIAEHMDGAFDALALAPYLTPTDEQRAGYSANTSVDQVITDTRANIATSVEWVTNHRRLADVWSQRLGRSIQLLAYEGGPHLDGRNEPYQPAFLAAVKDPRMGDVYADYLRGLNEAGLDLYLDYQFTAQDVDNPFGDFGKLHRMDQSLATSYSYNALVAAADGSLWAPQFGITPVGAQAKPEDAGGHGTVFTFTIRRTGDTGSSASVSWTVGGSGSHPASASDFAGGLLPSGRVTFAAGETSRTITLSVSGDDEEEGDEQFLVRLFDAVGAVVGPSAASASGTILEDDDHSAPQISGMTVEGSELEVQLSEPVVTIGLVPSLNPARFSVTVAGRPRAIGAITPVAGDPGRLRLRLSGPAPSSREGVQLRYQDPSPADESSGVVQDMVGNDMASTVLPFSAGSLRSARSVTALAGAYRDLVLTGMAITGAGNAADNRIRAEQNSAIANVLIGDGGIDGLDGVEGSDLYVITAASHHSAAEVYDSGSSGSDELRFASTTADETLTLFAGDGGLERVVIGTGSRTRAVTSGATALHVDASAAANGLTILGNAGANTLTGTAFADHIAGGSGPDRLTGGGGADVFRFDAALSATSNTDVLTDFNPAEGDRIELENAIFRGLPSGPLSAAVFAAGSAAITPTQRILYTRGSGSSPGTLIYDANGSAAGGARVFALVPAGLELEASLFTIT